jgi:hypothetical protein
MEKPIKKKPMRKNELQRESRRLGELALETLASIMNSKEQASVRLAAAREVLDRGFSRPPIGEPQPAKPPAEDGFRVVVRQFTDERDDDPKPDEESDA